MTPVSGAIHRLLALCVLLAVAALAFGFWTFGQAATRAGPPPAPPRADAVVALTGANTLRLTAALALLTEGKGERLLITGVDPKATDREVAAVIGAAPGDLARIDFGREARTTIGNAYETAAWARRRDYARLIVVTEAYHMPRALLELRAALPEATLIAYPVVSDAMARADWWRDGAIVERLFDEYLKLSAARAREATFAVFGREETGGS